MRVVFMLSEVHAYGCKAVARKKIRRGGGGGGGELPIVSVYITTFYSFASSPLYCHALCDVSVRVYCALLQCMQPSIACGAAQSPVRAVLAVRAVWGSPVLAVRAAQCLQ